MSIVQFTCSSCQYESGLPAQPKKCPSCRVPVAEPWLQRGHFPTFASYHRLGSLGRYPRSAAEDESENESERQRHPSPWGAVGGIRAWVVADVSHEYGTITVAPLDTAAPRAQDNDYEFTANASSNAANGAGRPRQAGTRSRRISARDRGRSLAWLRAEYGNTYGELVDGHRVGPIDECPGCNPGVRESEELPF